jgi:hypothetical protein
LRRRDGVPETFANIGAIASDLGYAPTTPIDVGVPKFVACSGGIGGFERNGRCGWTPPFVEKLIDSVDLGNTLGWNAVNRYLRIEVPACIDLDAVSMKDGRKSFIRRRRIGPDFHLVTGL